MKIKNILLTIAFMGSVKIALAQQQSQYSQYMFNYFLINPAVAGIEDYTDIRTGYRNQWSGMKGAPKTYYLTAHTPVNKIHDTHGPKRQNKINKAYHVIGAIANAKKLGALSDISAYLSYAYHLPLTKKWTLSMGCSAGMIQYTLNQNMLDFGDEAADPASTGLNGIKPDLGIGFWLYSSKLFGGISTMQVFESSIGDEGKLNRHFYLTGGYNFTLNRECNLVPSIVLKTVPFSAWQIDINAKLKYRNLLWTGISYRRSDAIALMTGVNIKNLAEIGYSYDITTSGLNKYSNGTHEIMLALKLSRKAKTISPSDFW